MSQVIYLIQVLPFNKATESITCLGEAMNRSWKYNVRERQETVFNLYGNSIDIERFNGEQQLSREST
jgi:hypothetical protein